MKTIAQHNTQTTASHDDVHQAGKAGLAAMTLLGGLVGAWGITCLVAAFVTNGAGGVLTGFITAVTGM